MKPNHHHAFALLGLLVVIGVALPARADDVEGDRSVPSKHLGVYATAGGIVGSTPFDVTGDSNDDWPRTMRGNLDGVQSGGLVLGAAVGGILELSPRFDLQLRVGFLVQLSGDFDPSASRCGQCQFEWDSTPSSRSLFYVETTARYRPLAHSTFYAGLGARLGTTSTSVTFNGTLTDDAPIGPPLVLHERHDERYLLAAVIAEIGIVFGPIDLGLRGGYTLLTTEDAAPTLELTAGWYFL